MENVVKRIICYLGSIRSDDLLKPSRQREFLARVYQQLDNSNLSPTETAKFKIKLIRLVLHENRLQRS